MSRRRQHDGRTDLRKASLKRLRDALALMEAGTAHARGAGYLGGYAIECKLKAIAMEIHGCWTLAQLARKWEVNDTVVYTHGLEAMVRRLPFYSRFQKSAVWRDFTDQVNRWRVHWRYEPRDWNQRECRSFLKAVVRVYHWLGSNC